MATGTQLRPTVHGTGTADTTPVSIDVSSVANMYLLHVRVVSGVEVSVTGPATDASGSQSGDVTAQAALPGFPAITCGPWDPARGNPKAYAASSQAFYYTIEEVWGEA